MPWSRTTVVGVGYPCHTHFFHHNRRARLRQQTPQVEVCTLTCKVVCLVWVGVVLRGVGRIFVLQTLPMRAGLNAGLLWLCFRCLRPACRVRVRVTWFRRSTMCVLGHG
jgi:hypothetical protein